MLIDSVPPKPPPSQHDILVRRAVRWLFGTQRCEAVYAERSPGDSGEVPDVLGFQSSTISILVECKISMQDFYSDRCKPCRRNPEQGVGAYRWYLCPPEIIDLSRNNLPDNWGLIIMRPRTIKVVKQAGRIRTRNFRREMKFLLSSTRERNPIEEERAT